MHANADMARITSHKLESGDMQHLSWSAGEKRERWQELGSAAALLHCPCGPWLPPPEHPAQPRGTALLHFCYVECSDAVCYSRQLSMTAPCSIGKQKDGLHEPGRRCQADSISYTAADSMQHAKCVRQEGTMELYIAAVAL